MVVEAEIPSNLFSNSHSLEGNCGPLSDTIVSGTPNRENDLD